MKARVIVPSAPTAAVSAGKAGRERGPSQTPPAFAEVLEKRHEHDPLEAAWGYPPTARHALAVRPGPRCASGQTIVRRLPTGGPWLSARAVCTSFSKSPIRLPVRPLRDGAWPSEDEPSGRRWTETLTLQSTTLCRQPRNTPRSRNRPGRLPCLQRCNRSQGRSRFSSSTRRFVLSPLSLSPGIRITPTTRSAKSCSDWRARGSRTMSAREYGRLRGDDPRMVSAAEGWGEQDRTGSETGRWRRAGWSSAARGRFARLHATGIGALAAGVVSHPRRFGRALLRSAGLSDFEISIRSPPASGGPVHTTLPDRPDRKAELVRRGIRRTRPMNRLRGTRTEIAGQLLLRRFSDPCARPTAAVPSGDGLPRATAGANGTKGASAHLRCGSKVPSLGVAAPRNPVGETAFGRFIRLGTSLAHRGVGFFCAPRWS
jgi:hypothetical protein